MSDTDLTVAVTGPTGTFGFGLMPLLQADDRVSRVVGIARRPFDAAAQGWSKMEYRARQRTRSRHAHVGIQRFDVVVHLAFLVVGRRSETTRAINIDGTVNAFRAAQPRQARDDSCMRHCPWRPTASTATTRSEYPKTGPPDRPTGCRYAEEKAELEEFLHGEAAAHPDIALYVLRPCIVLGPPTVGAKDLALGPLAGLARRLSGRLGRLPVPVPSARTWLSCAMQFVHADDVGRALLQCIIGTGPTGTYNITHKGCFSPSGCGQQLFFIPIAWPWRCCLAQHILPSTQRMALAGPRNPKTELEQIPGQDHQQQQGQGHPK